jgi:cation diffusion facilitator CzcD-associated flavoprotein CzcO
MILIVLSESSLCRTVTNWMNCKWILDLEKAGEDGVWHSHGSEEFNFVILCLGNYSQKPSLPSFPAGKGPEIFRGESSHSATFQNGTHLQVRER